ncbi:MAG: DUF2336 domain-containing protein, partial [Pseudomonadota bacterium]
HLDIDKSGDVLFEGGLIGHGGQRIEVVAGLFKYLPAALGEERLVDLAKETSSETRRNLLREITDVFMAAPDEHSESEREHFDSILTHVAGEVEVALRAELAERMADVAGAPKNLINKLARDEIEVAGPVLSRSPVLQEEDLLAIAEESGSGHLNAISSRETVSERLADKLVERGDDTVLKTLAENKGAQLSRGAVETMVERASANEALQAPLVSREDMPPDLMNDMYFFVSKALREEILQKSENLDAAVVDKLIEDSRAAVVKSALSVNAAKSSTERVVAEHIEAGLLDEARMLRFLVDKQLGEFLLAFAYLTDVDKPTAQRILRDKTCESIAIASKAAQFDRGTFSKIAAMLHGDRSATAADGMRLLDLYNEMTVETAQRVMRFWRIRKQSIETEQGDGAQAVA